MDITESENTDDLITTDATVTEAVSAAVPVVDKSSTSARVDFSSSSSNKESCNNVSRDQMQQQFLPWNWRRERVQVFGISAGADKNTRPGEFVLRALFAEFGSQVEKKMDFVLAPEASEKPLSKLLQRGEDVAFDQLLTAFGSVAEHCLPSLLRTLFAWYERQISVTQEIVEQKCLKVMTTDSQSKATGKNVVQESIEKNEFYYLLEKRDLCIQYIFCLFLIEVLKQLPLHPGHEDLISYIENLAFKHFKYTERNQMDPNISSFNLISDLYAEVVGVLAQSRFQMVRKRFTDELNELRAKEASPYNTNCIISLLMGMKFFRIKMVPIEEFEASFQFMKECANYFLEVKDKDIKHALAGLFVEILIPVAASVKNEVNVPCLKNFVEMLFSPTLDLCTKKKHMLAIFPLVTCLLCVSQKSFFLQNWHYFLAICLSNLKNRDQKMSRVALESLFRLLWVYMIRIKCESNTATQSRLHSIVNSLFPKGSKAVVPRDTPLNIFVKIIQFIAQERLDFAMKEIVYDLLSVGRPIKIILTPERMSIGLRAFLVVADSLQQKEGEPPMPRTSVLPSGNVQRVKKTFLNKLLTEEMAKSIGVHHYYTFVRKALNDILRALDIQLGKPLLKNTITNTHKEFDELITGERKPKIDLFRTCVAAIPRLLPEGMSRQDLINLLCRLTIHVDEEMNGLAFQALQNIVNDFEDWRELVIDGFICFIMQEINDTHAQLLEHSMRMLLQLVSSWKLCTQSKTGMDDLAASDLRILNKSNQALSSKIPSITSQCVKTQQSTGSSLNESIALEDDADPSLTSISNLQADNQPDHNYPLVLHKVEALCVTALCSGRQPTRRLAVHLLKEIRTLMRSGNAPVRQPPLIEVLDRISPFAFKTCNSYLSHNERLTLAATSAGQPIDLQWLTERSGPSWTTECIEGTETAGNCASPTTLDSSLKDLIEIETIDCKDSIASKESKDLKESIGFRPNAWIVCLMELMGEMRSQCPTSTLFAYCYASQRMQTLFQLIDTHPSGDNRASALLRGATSAPRKTITERPLYLSWWRSYLMLVCRIAPGDDPQPSLPVDQNSLSAASLSASASVCGSTANLSSFGNNQSSTTPNTASTAQLLVASGSSNTSTTSSLVSSVASSSTLVNPSPTGSSFPSLMGSSITCNSSLSGSTSVLTQQTPTSSLGSSLIGPSLGALSGSLLGSTSSGITSMSSSLSSTPRLPQTVQLLRATLSLLRSEQAYIRFAAVLGLAQVQTAVVPLLLYEITSLVRECIDRKQENMRRRKRREQLRSHFGKLLLLLAEQKTLANSPAVLENDVLCSILSEYIDGVRLYLEHDTAAKETDMAQRTQFAVFVSRLISGFSVDARAQLLGADLRRNLFHLFANQAGSTTSALFRSNTNPFAAPPSACSFGCYNTSFDCPQCRVQLEEQSLSGAELAALQAMSAVLCCGRVFSENCLSEGSAIFRWLLALLSSGTTLRKLGQESIVLLLEYNPDVGCLLDWLVDICYTRTAHVADTCFSALATIFAIREYPCDQYIAIVNLALLYVRSASSELQQMAVRLLQLLHHRFFDSIPTAQLRLSSAAVSVDNSNGQSEINCQHAPTKHVLSDPSQLDGLYEQKGALEIIATNHEWPVDDPCTKGGLSETQSECSETDDLDRTLVDGDLVKLRHINISSANNEQQRRSPSSDPFTVLFAPINEFLNDSHSSNCNSSDNLQQTLSTRLAQLHPQITMAIFSEITYRFQTARPAVAQQLLGYLIPWLYNMELVDAHLAFPPHPMCYTDRTSTRKEGWGSVEATEMVLNNLFYMSVKFANSHPVELDQLWVALASNWPNNVRVIIRYLFIITALAPDELLPHSKRVCLYLGRARPARLVDELMVELQTVETLNFLIERTKTPPFYRITNTRKYSAQADQADDQEVDGLNDESLTTATSIESSRIRSTSSAAGDSTTGVSIGSVNAVDFSVRQTEVGILHTKRHSTESSERLFKENPEILGYGVNRRRPDTWHSALASARLVSTTGGSNTKNTFVTSGNSGPGISRRSRKCMTPQPMPLPMPEYGGYYAPLNEYLGEAGQPVIAFHRCNLSVMFLCNLLLDGLKLDWSPHLPLLLHISLLGLDHPRPLVHQHCRQLLINVLCTLTPRRHLLSVARITLHNHAAMLGYGLSVPSAEDLPTGVDFTQPPEEMLGNLSSISSRKSSIGRNRSFALAEMLAPEASSWRVADSIKCEPTELTNVGMDTMGDNESNANTLHQDGHQLSQHATFGSGDDETPVHHRAVKLSTIQEASGDQLLLGLLHFLTSRDENQTLWNWEDITAKLWTIPSAQQLTHFLRHVLKVLDERVPGAHVSERWAEVALQLALSCSSRHLAGRSLQIFRAIHQPINCRILADILSRLVETVAEQGDDMQGYVTELMLTLESCVEALDSDRRELGECVREMFKSTPNLRKRLPKSAPTIGNRIYVSDNVAALAKQRVRSRTDCDLLINSGDQSGEQLNRSRSAHSLQQLAAQWAASGQSSQESSACNTQPHLLASDSNSGSAYLSVEDRTQLQVQLLLVAVAMLETDYEHEFLLAVRLLDKLLKHVPLQSKECEARLAKLLLQCRWNNFLGLHALLLKGLTSSNTFEPTVALLHRLTPLLHNALVDPSESCSSFPFHVMALLPYMLQHYDEPNPLCVRAAQQIAVRCSQQSSKLDNLATVMSLYSRRAFSKESFQWTKCVVKYLYDAQPQPFSGIISFLVEVLEKGPSTLSTHIISILHCILHYVEISCVPSIYLNNDLQKIVLKYVEGAQWKDSLKILKLIVTRSSSLAAAPTYASSGTLMGSTCASSLPSSTIHSSTPLTSISAGSSLSGTSLPISTLSTAGSGAVSLCSSVNYSSLPSEGTTIIASTASFCESELVGKRELPGRTIDFTFDLTQTPIVGRKYINQAAASQQQQQSEQQYMSGYTPVNTQPSNETDETTPPRRSLSYTCSFTGENNSNWRRPWLCQSRVRERLVSLLSSCGQRVGLPKSPSVIFSQSSDVVDRQSSLTSSTEEISTAPPDSRPDASMVNTGSAEQFGLFKEFDFLEYELGSQEEESMDNFNWGVRRRSLSSLTSGRQEAPPPPRSGSPASVPAVILRKEPDLSSDDEGGRVSPLFNYNNELNLQEFSPSIRDNVSSSPSSVSSLSSTCSLTILNQLK